MCSCERLPKYSKTQSNINVKVTIHYFIILVVYIPDYVKHTKYICRLKKGDVAGTDLPILHHLESC